MFFVALFALAAALFGFGVISFGTLLFVLFILVLGVLIYSDRKHVKLQGIILIRRTSKGRSTIDRIANRHKRFWNVLSFAGIVVAIPAMLIISVFLLNSSYLLITKQSDEGAARFLLPAPVEQPVAIPGMLLIPWWIWVIAIPFVIIPHELFHGIMCRLEKIRVKSVGWILLLFIPGAFVEPDEPQLKKAKHSTKLKVYAAGSFANILTGLAFILVLVLLSGLFVPVGSSFLLVKDGPAHKANLTGSIMEIDGKRILSEDDLQSALQGKNPGDIVEVKTALNKDAAPVFFARGLETFVPVFGLVVDENQASTHRIELGSRSDGEGAFLGVDTSSFVQAFAFPIPMFLYQLIFWIYVFSVGIGLVNLLPIKPLDGGLFFEELIGKTKMNQAIVKAVSSVMILLLVFNLVGPWII